MSTVPPPTSRLPVHRSPAARPNLRVPLRDISQTAFPPASREIPLAPQHRARDWPFLRGLVSADLVATFVAIGTCLGLAPHVEATAATLIAGPLILVLAMLARLYRRDEMLISKTTLDEAPRLAAVAGLGALILWEAEGVVFNGSLYKGDILLLWAVLSVSLVLSRRGARWDARRHAPAERCLVVGPLSAEQRLAAALAGAGDPGRIVGRISPDRIMHAPVGSTRAVSARALAGLVSQFHVDRVVVADEATDTGTTLELLRISRSLDVRVSFLPTALGALGPGLEFDDVHGLPLIGVQRFGLTRGERIAKRFLDIVGAGIGLLFLAPLFAIIALAIKLGSSGPVFFRQVRIGRDGRAFRIFKFRTMATDAEQRKAELYAMNEVDGLFKIARDPRVTRIGRLLRRTSLDELPQLLNVVRGEMSL